MNKYLFCIKPHVIIYLIFICLFYYLQEAKDYCTPSPCKLGSCLNTPEGYYCHCPPTHGGQLCDMLRICQNPPCNGKLIAIFNF